MTKPKDELHLIPEDRMSIYKKNPLVVTLVAEKYNVSRGRAFQTMDYARQIYGITYDEFVTKNLMANPTDEVFAACKAAKAEERQYYINLIAEEKGWTLEETEAEVKRILEKFKIGVKAYYNKQLYALTDEEIADHKEKLAAERESRLAYIQTQTDMTPLQIKRHLRRFRLKYGLTLVHYMAFKGWNLTDEDLDTYALMRHSRQLCDKYNGDLSVIYDKAKFNEAFAGYTQRKFWVNRDTDFESFVTFTDGLSAIFCKPLDLEGGIGTEKIQLTADIDLTALYEDLMSRPKCIVEEFVEQHPVMSSVYQGSVNTVRIVTLLDKGVFVPLYALVRFGRYGSNDNFKTGGVLAGVNLKTGTVFTDAVDKDGNRYETHPVSGAAFKGLQIPHWDEVLRITEAALRHQEHINYVGWDVAICKDKVVIIEGNTRPGFTGYQSLFSPEKKGQKYLYEAYLPEEE